MKRSNFAVFAALALVAGTLPLTSAQAQQRPVQVQPKPLEKHPCPTSVPCLFSGGIGGDYWLHYGPPMVKVLRNTTWEDDLKLATSDGTPANMKAVLENPNSYGLGQGNVLADLLGVDPFKDKLRIIPTKPIGQEFIFLVVTPQIYERTQIYGTIANNADRVKFALPSENSGPGKTFDQLKVMDPRMQKATRVERFKDVDAALAEVADGRAGATLVVQAVNAENPRFKFIKDKKLGVIPVRLPKMMDVKLPDGSDAFTLCGNQDFGGGKVLEGACTPILLFANAENNNKHLASMADVPSEQFAPQDGAFLKAWKAGWTYAKNKGNALADWTKEAGSNTRL